MSLSTISSRLLIILSVALLVGMVLVNVVVLEFWFHDALRREMTRDHIVLAQIQRGLTAAGENPLPAETLPYTFAELYAQEDHGILTIAYKDTLISFPSHKQQDNLAASLLNESLKKTLASGQSVVHARGTLLSALFTGSLILVRAEPIKREDTIIAAVGVMRHLSSITRTLRKAEATILIYIGVNILFLGLILFFRIRALLTVPLQRLIDLAEQYRKGGGFYLPSEDSGGELSQLASSMNRMVATIENDKKNLEQAVIRLEEANRQLKQQQDEMIRAEKLASVGRMAAGLAHEIGNPLGVVQGYLGLLKKADCSTENTNVFIERSEEEIRRISELIRQLLDFARIPEGKSEIVSLHALLDSILTMMRAQPDFRDITIQDCFRAEWDEVYVDPDQMRQVFLNCMFNSLDAIKDRQSKDRGIILVETAVHYEENNTTSNPVGILVRIQDNGVGMKEEDIDFIFDPFYTTKEPGKGTGLGLSVSLSIVQSFGGTMKCISSQGKGFELMIALPLASEPSVDLPAES